MTSNKAIDFFSEVYFWEYDLNNILLDEDSNLIIERVLSQSPNLDIDLVQLESFYSINLIINIIKKRNNQIFGNERIEIISKRYNLDLNNFKRYYFL